MRSTEGSGLGWESEIARIKACGAWNRYMDAFDQRFRNQAPDGQRWAEKARQEAAKAVEAKIRIDGDEATLSVGGVDYDLHRVNDDWRVVCELPVIGDDGRSLFLKQLSEWRALARAYDEAIAAINSGEIKTERDAMPFVRERAAKYSATQPTTRKTQE